MYVFVLQSITVSALVQMRSCQMNAVWHRCFGVIITWQMLMRMLSTRNCSGRITETAYLSSPKPLRTPLQLFGSDWMCINAYVMVLAYTVCFRIVCWKLWFMIASLVYSLVSCGPVRPSVVANRGDGKLLRSLTKCLWAWSSQVIIPSHRRVHTYTLPHTHTQYTHNSLFWGGSIAVCLADKFSRFLAWKILPHPIHPPLTFSTHLC